MYKVGDLGFIKYNDKLVTCQIMEIHGGYYVVKTEEGDILGIPPESNTYIWKTKQDYERYEAWKDYGFVPQEEN